MRNAFQILVREKNTTKYNNSFHRESKYQDENQTKAAAFKPYEYMITLGNTRHPAKKALKTLEKTISTTVLRGLK